MTINEAEEELQDSRAAILCTHVARERLPILRAIRDEPETEEDSGWQFHCGLDCHDNPDDAEVWLVFEVLNYDPSLNKIITCQHGSVATRSSEAESWSIQN
ncbi:MAG: immunity protein Imm33 domain-containing protein [Candidatus Sumerlaeaceae bacterium]